MSARCDRFFDFEMENGNGELFLILSVRCDLEASHGGDCQCPPMVEFRDGTQLRVLAAVYTGTGAGSAQTGAR